jgi:hypothetical protein
MKLPPIEHSAEPNFMGEKLVIPRNKVMLASIAKLEDKQIEE